MAKQLRGSSLDKAIRDGILELSVQAGDDYVYNATQLANLIGTSRVTLNKKAELIDDVLRSIKAGRRKKDNEGLIDALQLRIDRLEKQKADLEKELHALQRNHVDIYRNIYMHSIDGAALVAPIVKSEAGDDCPLCGQKFSDKPESRKVVSLRRKGDA